MVNDELISSVQTMFVSIRRSARLLQLKCDEQPKNFDILDCLLLCNILWRKVLYLVVVSTEKLFRRLKLKKENLQIIYRNCWVKQEIEWILTFSILSTLYYNWVKMNSPIITVHDNKENCNKLTYQKWDGPDITLHGGMSDFVALYQVGTVIQNTEISD